MENKHPAKEDMKEAEHFTSPENAGTPDRTAGKDTAGTAPRKKKSPVHPVRMQRIPAHLEGAALLEKLCFSHPWSVGSLELLTNDGIGVGYICPLPAPSAGSAVPSANDTPETTVPAEPATAIPTAAVPEPAIPTAAVPETAIPTTAVPTAAVPTAAAYGGMLITVDEGQITNIAVHPDYRRKGYGKAVVRALLRHAKDEHLGSVSLEVRVSNKAAIALYRSVGFTEVGRRRGFYAKPTEDALIMECRLK